MVLFGCWTCQFKILDENKNTDELPEFCNLDSYPTSILLELSLLCRLMMVHIFVIFQDHQQPCSHSEIRIFFFVLLFFSVGRRSKLNAELLVGAFLISCN